MELVWRDRKLHSNPGGQWYLHLPKQAVQSLGQSRIVDIVVSEKGILIVPAGQTQE